MRTDISASHDEGNAIGVDDVGEVIGFLDADISREGAEKHGNDQDAGAEAEL